MPSHLLVERALALVPDAEEFLPLTDAVIGTSRADRDKIWARSGAYATVGKRVVDPKRLGELIPTILERTQRRLQELFTLVVRAIEEQQAGRIGAAAETLVRAGELEEDERKLEKAEAIYLLALELAQDLREKEPQILALRRLGRVLRSLGRLEEAWSRYEQSYQLSVDQMHLPGQVIACQGLGNLCDDRGLRSQARAWYERGIRLAHGLDDPALTWPFFTNLSVLAMQGGELDEAERHLARAREMIEAVGDDSAMTFWYNNKGMLLDHTDAVAAEAVFREALDRTPHPFWQVILRTNLGQTLVKQGRLFEAEEEARGAEELAIVHRYIPNLVEVYDLLGCISRARADEEGFVFYEQALEVCHERSLPTVKEALVYRGYGLLHRACGRVSEAMAYLEKSRELYSSLGLRVEVERLDTDLDDLTPAISA